MSPTDLEQELRRLALAPRENAAHREALAAALQNRFQARRRRRQAVLVAATFLLVSGIMVRQSDVVSYGFRHSNVEQLNDGTILMSRFQGDPNPYSVLPGIGGETNLDHMEQHAANQDRLHAAGEDRLVSVLGVETAHGVFATASYEAISGSDTVHVGYLVRKEIPDIFQRLAQNGHLARAMAAARKELLPLLPDSLAVIDGVPVRLHRWLAHAPGVGDFVLLRGRPDPTAAVTTALSR